ncbi:hypothetical protein P7C70_g599, partial [Phenoliferia sp. Uapishka_3]
MHWADEDSEEEDETSLAQRDPLFWASSLAGDTDVISAGLDGGARMNARRNVIHLVSGIDEDGSLGAVERALRRRTEQHRQRREQEDQDRDAADAAASRARMTSLTSRMESILESPLSPPPPRRSRLLRRLGRYLGDSDSGEDNNSSRERNRERDLRDNRDRDDRERERRRIERGHRERARAQVNRDLDGLRAGSDDAPSSSLIEGIWRVPTGEDDADFVIVDSPAETDEEDGQRRRGAFMEDLERDSLVEGAGGNDEHTSVFREYSEMQRAGARRRLEALVEADGDMVMADLARAGRELSDLRARIVGLAEDEGAATTATSSSAPTPRSLFSSADSPSSAPSPASLCPASPRPSTPSTIPVASSASLAEAAVRANRAIRPLPTSTAVPSPRVARGSLPSRLPDFAAPRRGPLDSLTPTDW